MQNKDSIINFRLNFIVSNREYMNFKLLKLNLKIAWLKFSGKIELIKDSSNFSLNDLESPKILIILYKFSQVIINLTFLSNAQYNL